MMFPPNAETSIEGLIFDTPWLQQNRDIVRTWSPFVVCWAIHHNFLMLSGSVFYPLAFQTHGFASADQERAFTDLAIQRHHILTLREEFSNVYSMYSFSKYAHQVPVVYGPAYDAAEALIKHLYRGLSEAVPALCSIGHALAAGEYCVVNDQQAYIFNVMAQINERLRKLVEFLELWTTISN